MKRCFARSLALAGLVFSSFALVQTTVAQTKTVRVLCSNGIRAAVEKLTPEIEKSIGRKLSIEFSSSTVLKKEIDGGAPFDLTIMTPALIEELAKAGRVVAGSPVTVASADLGVGVKAGSPKVDVSNAETMKKRLLAAKSLTWTDGGAASTATVAMFKTLGIEEQLKPKVVLQKTPGTPAETIARGEYELMFGPISEIGTVKGVEVLGLFPKEFQKPVVMTAGIGAQGKDAEGAKALVNFLTSAKAVAAIQASGMKPAK